MWSRLCFEKMKASEASVYGVYEVNYDFSGHAFSHELTAGAQPALSNLMWSLASHRAHMLPPQELVPWALNQSGVRRRKALCVEAEIFP